ncbi:MAG: hypothetical protein HYS27_09705 [Deltaproteobacteria bacterium]|nr:hypothetical protein [Deltaproteobacteria bacterium]
MSDGETVAKELVDAHKAELGDTLADDVNAPRRASHVVPSWPISVCDELEHAVGRIGTAKRKLQGWCWFRRRLHFFPAGVAGVKTLRRSPLGWIGNRQAGVIDDRERRYGEYGDPPDPKHVRTFASEREARG